MTDQYFYVRIIDQTGVENLATGIQVKVDGNLPLDEAAVAKALGRIVEELSRYALHETFQALAYRRAALTANQGQPR